MATKLSKLKAAMGRGDKIEAIRIAAKFPRLGKEKERITRGWAAHQSPVLYRQMGKDPAALISDALAAIKERYKL